VYTYARLMLLWSAQGLPGAPSPFVGIYERLGELSAWLTKDKVFDIYTQLSDFIASHSAWAQTEFQIENIMMKLTPLIALDEQGATRGLVVEALLRYVALVTTDIVWSLREPAAAAC